MADSRPDRRPHAQHLLRQRHGSRPPRGRSGAPVSHRISPRRPRLPGDPARLGPPLPSFSLRRGRAHLPAAHIPHALYHLWKRLRIRLHSAQGLELVFSELFSGAFLFQSWPACLDAYSSSRHRRPFYFLAAAAPRRHSVSRRLSRFLPFYLLLPRLGRHLFLRQPLFRFPHSAFHSWPRRFPRPRRSTLPLPPRHSRRRASPSRRLHFLERRPHVPMGLPSDSRARPRFLFRNNTQSIFRRAPPALH